MRKLTTTITITMLLAAGVISGCHCKNKESFMADMAVKKITSELELNESQQKALNAYSSQAVADFKEGRSSHKQIAEQVKNMLTENKFSSEALKKAIDEELKARSDLAYKWVDKVGEFQSTLSPEQRQKAVKLIEKIESRFDNEN